VVRELGALKTVAVIVTILSRPSNLAKVVSNQWGKSGLQSNTMFLGSPRVTVRLSVCQPAMARCRVKRTASPSMQHSVLLTFTCSVFIVVKRWSFLYNRSTMSYELCVTMCHCCSPAIVLQNELNQLRCGLLRSMTPGVSQSVSLPVCLSRGFAVQTRLSGSRSCLWGTDSDFWGRKEHGIRRTDRHTN